MYFSDRAIFRALSVMAILLGTSGCAQDTMIRIDPTSSLKLVPSKEIRYKACGESSDSCKEILENVNNKKSAVATIAHARYLEYKNNQARSKISPNQSPKCINMNPANTGVFNASDYMCRSNIEPTIIDFTPNHIVDPDESSFNPTEEDHKKIIQSVSIANLNEYTFSKPDGSIVVICPTRYCAIASADGGWIGIGERGKPNQITELISK
ncbi:hypothetical protein [Chamaesiphon sp. VAR_48_metabat_135_sub]|uniref:hypothetical protein n=1 Tax=Chamaesiphon sp. VAR_48_metabat_135_sub TaxID=2964699 RepID=UPI00286AA2DC|nr:hypothetical protein [Chamaesiphon sp. VAR_48_metabat_135_sub]